MFPCSEILYQSLGLDIPSVLLNPFKMAATYPFWNFLLSKNLVDIWFPRDTLWVEKVWLIPTNFPFEWETSSNRILSIFISKLYSHEVVPIYWFALTLDFCSEKSINTFYSSSILDYLHYQMMSSQEHFHSYRNGKWWI